jgi:MFS family permease
VARFAAAKEKEADAQLGAAAAAAGGAATGQAPPRAEPVDVGKMVGIIAALGVGAGAIGALFGGFVSGFLGLQPWWAKLVALAGMVMVISGPSMLIAWLKLRQRNLAPVLDANGWAVNGRVRVNLPLGTALTSLASLPAGASRSLEDPFLDREARLHRRLLLFLVFLVALALTLTWRQGRWPFGPWAP